MQWTFLPKRLAWIIQLPKRWADGERWLKTLSFVAAAIAVTIIGDNTFELLTGEFESMSNGERWWRGLLVGMTIVAVAGGVDEFIGLLRRPASPDVSRLRKLAPTPALIVIASRSKDPKSGPHWTAFKDLSKSPSPLRFVFIIHSTHAQSQTSAAALKNDIESFHKPISVELLESDFESPEAMLTTVNMAIDKALAEVHTPENIILDATGGTAVASIGAAMAKLANPGILLGYIPNKENGDFGDTVMRVDLAMHPVGRDTTDATGAESSFAN